MVKYFCDICDKEVLTEYLCDAANYLMFEFMWPQVPGAFFKATDSKDSAGIVGISEKEMEEYKNADY